MMDFTDTAAITRRLAGQRTAALNAEARLREVIAAGAAADAQTILRGQFGGGWAGLPSAVLTNFLHALVASRPLLRVELRQVYAEARKLPNPSGTAPGALCVDPFEAVLAGSAAYAAAVRIRAAGGHGTLAQYSAAYQVRVEAIDARHDQLAAQHDAVITKLRGQYANGCAAAVEGAPTERLYSGIERAATTLYAATRRLVIAAPGARHYPDLTRGQVRRLRARLRARQARWLKSLEVARGQTHQGEFLDSLSLLVTINRELLTEAGLMTETDWRGIARLLAADLAAWDRATQDWSARAEAAVRGCLASYQRLGQQRQQDYLAARAPLMSRRLEALLDLVDESRRLDQRQPLGSVVVLLEQVTSGMLSF
jgi:hypothetical protein